MEGSDEFQHRPAGDLPGRQRPSAAPAPELGCHTGPEGWILPRTPPGIGEMPVHSRPAKSAAIQGMSVG
jgi:hypothetical protein